MPRRFHLPKYWLYTSSLCCAHLCYGASIDKALVESAILINLQEFHNSNEHKQNTYQRRLSVNAGTSIQGIIDLNRSSLPEITALTNSLSSTFSSFPNESLSEAVEYSINYLSDNKNNFNLSDRDLL